MSLFRRVKTGTGAEKGGNPFLGLFVMILTLALTALSYNTFTSGTSRSRAADIAGASIALGEETMPLRLEVSAQGRGTRVRATLKDLSGQELCIIERDLPGSTVAVDFYLVSAQAGLKSASPRFIAFPRRIYGDGLEPASGTNMLGSYDRGGFPAIYEGIPSGGKAMDAGAKRALSSLFIALGKAETGGAKSFPPGTTRCAIVIRTPKEGAIYDIVMRANGEAVARVVPGAE